MRMYSKPEYYFFNEVWKAMGKRGRSCRLYLITALFVLLPISLFADEIHTKKGSILKGKIQSVSPDEINFIPEGRDEEIDVARSDVIKIMYDDGTEVNMQELSEEEGAPSSFGIIREDKTELFLLPFMLRLGLILNKGNTTVNIYDKNEEKIADGDADFDQYMIEASYEPVESAFYITPELGYFYRKVAVQDYSYSVESVNQGVEGFIPGVVTDPETGETYSKEAVSSLAYNAIFHSFFLYLKTGYNLVFGFESCRFILNPYIYGGLAELRKSVFEFTLFDKKEKYSRPYEFYFLSTFGIGAEVGMYFPGLRSGVKIGGDYRYLPMFEMSDKVIFKEVYEDEELGIMRTRDNSAKYTSIHATLFTVEFFFFL